MSGRGVEMFRGMSRGNVWGGIVWWYLYLVPVGRRGISYAYSLSSANALLVQAQCLGVSMGIIQKGCPSYVQGEMSGFPYRIMSLYAYRL